MNLQLEKKSPLRVYNARPDGRGGVGGGRVGEEVSGGLGWEPLTRRVSVTVSLPPRSPHLSKKGRAYQRSSIWKRTPFHEYKV